MDFTIEHKCGFSYTFDAVTFIKSYTKNESKETYSFICPNCRDEIIPEFVNEIFHLLYSFSNLNEKESKLGFKIESITA